MNYKLKKPRRFINLLLLVILIGFEVFYKQAFWMLFWVIFVSNVVFECLLALFFRKTSIIAVIALLVLLYFTGIRTLDSYNTLQYINGAYITKSDLKSMISNIEQDSISKGFVNNPEYLDYKKQLLDMSSPRKKDFQKLLDTVKKVDTSEKLKYMYMQMSSIQRSQEQKISDMHQAGKTYLTSLKILKTAGMEVPCIRIYSFEEGLAEELTEAMKKVADKPYLILDLRGNPGGSQNVLIQVADIFLPSDIEVVTTIDSYHKTTWYTHNADDYKGEIIITVDEKTASCAEILALTLKISRPNKVLLLGNKTTKKGVGQQVHVYPSSGIRLAVVEFSWTVGVKDVGDLQRILKEDGDGKAFKEGKDYTLGIEEWLKQ